MGPDPGLVGGALLCFLNWGPAALVLLGKAPSFCSSRSLAQRPLSSLATCEVEVWMGCCLWPHSNTYPKL